MSYTAWSVVFGEQPTAAKWNQLGANDAGFKDGTNFDDSIIDSRHYADGSIDGEHLSTAAILLGKLNNASQSTSSASFADMTNGTLNVTVPSGGRTVILLAMFLPSGSAANLFDWRILGDGTPLTAGRLPLNGTGGWTSTVGAVAYDTPSAGAHTYKLQTAKATGSGSIDTTATLVALLA